MMGPRQCGRRALVLPLFAFDKDKSGPGICERQDDKLVNAGLRKNAVLDLWDRDSSTSVPQRKADLPRCNSAVNVPATAMATVAQRKLLPLHPIATLAQKLP